jgi:hypothetical protein
MPPPPIVGWASIRRRIRPHRLTLASVVLIVLAVWGSLIAFKHFPELANWKIPLGLGIAAAAFVLGILWKVPQWQVGYVSDLVPKEQFDRINEARKTLAQIVGGIVVLAGFYSTVQNLNVAQESLSLAQEGQITDRFTKAIEQLGAVDTSGGKKLEVRLGGIYALARIANESEKDHWPIMEVLAAYVRENAPRRDLQQGVKAPSTHTLLNDEPAADIQATGAELDGAYLDGAYLNRAQFSVPASITIVPSFGSGSCQGIKVREASYRVSRVI